MNEHEGKKCLINVEVNKKILVYTAIITKIDDTHITFIDKYNQKYTYRKENIVEIREVE